MFRAADQADEGAGGPGVAVEEAGEGGGGLGLAVLGSSLAVAVEEGQPQGAILGKSKALKDSWRWGLGRRARIAESRDRTAWFMAPVIRRETGGPFQVVPAHKYPQGAQVQVLSSLSILLFYAPGVGRRV